jgi:hypothetical protein
MFLKKAMFGIFIIIMMVPLFLGGCGGGGGGSASDPSVLSVISGVVSDGPIKNARVFLDLNNNGSYDSGEPFSITNDKGEYKIQYILDPGVEYLLIAEGSSALSTADPTDNPTQGSNLTFVMFTSVTANGTRNTAPAATTYNQDLTPATFKGYLTKLNNKLGSIYNTIIMDIVNSSLGSTDLFKTHIVKNPAELKNFVQKVGEFIQSTNEQQKLETTKNDIGADSTTGIDLKENTTIQSLSESLVYQNRTIALVGDIVISQSVAQPSTNDVILTNMNTASNVPKLTLTVKPGSLPDYSVSVTEYKNILQIPEFNSLRDKGYLVVLGADIRARKNNGAKDADQWLTCSPSSSTFDGLEYLYFNGTAWVNNGPVTSAMNTIKTTPFVIVKTNSTVEKTFNITGLSQLNKPVVIVKGYIASDPARTIMILDAFSVTQSSDNVIVKIPVNFIIYEVIVVDSELTKTVSDAKPSVSLPVSGDTLQTTVITVPLFQSGTKLITDQALYATLKNGSQDQNFTGVGSYIDSKVIYRGIDMFWGLAMDSAVKDVVSQNIKDFMENSAPVFYTGSGNYSGVTFDSAQKTIKVTLGEANTSTVVTWNFEQNKVVRTYRKDYTGGTKSGSSYSSTYSFSNTKNNLANVAFKETVKEMSNGTAVFNASYEGAAVYNRLDGTLQGATIDQKLTETNLVTKQSNVLDGLITMENGKLLFNGMYTFYLPSYGTIKGSVAITNAVYAMGYSSQDSAYFNNNNLQNANVLFTTAQDIPALSKNPAWFTGIWNGTFTDSCGTQNGQITMSATSVTATWWGQSSDKSRNYGSIVEISDTTVRLKNDAVLWSNGTKINDTRIEGSWSSGGCQGTFVLDKKI